MKKSLKILIGICALIFMNACSESFLEEEVLDKYAPESLTDRLGYEASIVGLHQQFGSWLKQNGDQTILGIWHLGTDIVWAPSGRSNGGARPFFDYAQLDATSGANRNVWSYLYKLINNANIVIANAEAGNAKNMSQIDLDVYNAEARFFRAYAYHMLVTLYGDVPLLNEPVTVPRTDFVRNPVAEIDQLIEGDLMFAIDHLPAIGTASKDGRANKAMAHHLLAEVYLRTGEDAKAEAQCNEVINGNAGPLSLITDRYGVNSGEPGDAFSDMFLIGNQRRSQGNTEAIWVHETENPTDVPHGTGFLQQRRVWVGGYYDIRGMQPTDSLGGRGLARIRLNDWVIYGLYEDEDMRNSKHNIRRQMYFNHPDPLYDPIRGLPVPYGESETFTLADGSTFTIHEADTIWRLTPYSTKWGEYDIRDNFGFGMWKDLIIMRLAETYLFRAEARFRQGNLSGAAADINVLRERANASLVDADDIDLNFILDERARELLAEENRRMTLVRTGTLVERAKRLNGTAPLADGEIETTNGLQDFHMKLPIPQAEIDLNKDADLGQNTGY